MALDLYFPLDVYKAVITVYRATLQLVNSLLRSFIIMSYQYVQLWKLVTSYEVTSIPV